MDDRIASVGSVNFDNRSFAINFEITLWFTDPKTIDGGRRRCWWTISPIAGRSI